VAAALAAGALLFGAATAQATPRVTVAILPAGTSVSDLARVHGMAVGVMSTGIGEVSPEQTYLDVSQGNRVDDALYDQPLPPARTPFLRVPGWSEIVRRADSAPADIVPGLLGSKLLDAGIRPEPARRAGSAALMVADRSGEIGRVVGGPVGLTVVSAGIAPVSRLAAALPSGGLMIAFAVPASGRQIVPIGIVGDGFGGNLTSDSTRTDGYVLSTDIAPTILDRLGLRIPDLMDGEPIESDGRVDAAAVDDLAERLSVIPDRREPLLIVSIGAWILVALAVGLFLFRLRRAAMAWLALCFAYMPLLLLAGAWLEPGAVAEGSLVGFGSALLAALTLRLAPGWRGLAIGCAIAVCAYAIDVIAGSGLTRLSLLGPNPIFGVRFYGIGNELEALFAVMVPAGVGAGLTAHTGWGRGVTRVGTPLNEGRAAAAFLVAGVVAGLIFGAGRFGADVGAAIVLPVGALVAAATLPTSGPIWAPKRRSRLLALTSAPFIVLVLLALIDLVSGANSHLTRSVIDAGGASNLADVAQRRLELSAHDFAQAADNPLFWVVIAGLVVAIAQWRRIDAWLRPAPIARAGLIGACAAVAVGVLVNDSGATFLVLGGLALGAFLAFAWSQAGIR
jgi:hypothetical protein